jgi:glutathione peroxidase
MKKKLTIGISIIMFFFKSSTLANYDKTFFDFEIQSISGEVINLNEYRNKVVLLVNTASYCGFTKQYADLQKLWDTYKSKGLIVLGVPSNSFNQEKKDNEDVKKFCEVNFNINFPLSTIVDVKGDNAHEIFKWAKNNHGKTAIPKWNFHKILINREGKIEDTFTSFTKPTSNKIIKKIEESL